MLNLTVQSEFVYCNSFTLLRPSQSQKLNIFDLLEISYMDQIDHAKFNDLKQVCKFCFRPKLVQKIKKLFNFLATCYGEQINYAEFNSVK